MTRAELGGALAIVLAAVVLSAAERVRPFDRGQRLLRRGFFTDLVFYGALQSWVLGVVIGRLVASLDGALASSSLGPSGHRLLAGWPVALQLVLFVVTHDLYIYAFHRLQHRVPSLWRIHEAHHATPEVDWLSGVRSHPIEILINQTVEFAPLILLGANPAVAPLKGAVSAIWGMFIHANLDVRLGPLGYLVNGPEMHRWHHALSPNALGKNFSTKLAIWDWVFGTAFRPARPERRPEAYGLSEEGFPSGYFAQVVHAFRPFRPKARREVAA